MKCDMQLHRGEVFYFTGPPDKGTDRYAYFPDGALVVSDGIIREAGAYDDISLRYPDAERIDHRGRLIMPGLIDAHVHFPQYRIQGMYGDQLLAWLNNYTFPAERRYGDLSQGEVTRQARRFIQHLFRHGTTACMAYAATFPHTVDALFEVASSCNMLMMTGKMMMNRNAPEALLDTTAQSEADSLRLIERWHGKGRNRYVVTPRFAITSTPDQLTVAGKLHAAFPDTYIQTHLSESREEVETVSRLFPGSRDYLDVYEKAGLLTRRSVFGHCIHLSADEWIRMREAGAVVAHCPTSNLFLGSGLFPLRQADTHGVPVALATDVAGGTSLSMFRTMDEAYKIQQLNDYTVSPLTFLYLSTLGAARALGLDESVGSFRVGNNADFIVVDYAATPDQAERLSFLDATGKLTVEQKLLGLQFLGDDRSVKSTYINGNCVHTR